MYIKVMHGENATEIDAGTRLAAAIAAVVCSGLKVEPAKPFSVLPYEQGILAESGPELVAAITAVICGEKKVEPAKPFAASAFDSVVGVGAGPGLTAALTAVISCYLDTYAPSFQAGRIKITSMQPVSSVAQSNWQFAGRISALESRSNFLRMRRR